MREGFVAPSHRTETVPSLGQSVAGGQTTTPRPASSCIGMSTSNVDSVNSIPAPNSTRSSFFPQQRQTTFPSWHFLFQYPQKQYESYTPSPLVNNPPSFPVNQYSLFTDLVTDNMLDYDTTKTSPLKRRLEATPTQSLVDESVNQLAKVSTSHQGAELTRAQPTNISGPLNPNLANRSVDVTTQIPNQHVVDQALHHFSTYDGNEEIESLQPLHKKRFKKSFKPGKNRIAKRQGILNFYHYELVSSMTTAISLRLVSCQQVAAILTTEKIELYSSESVTPPLSQAISHMVPICDKYSAHLIGKICLNDQICQGRVIVHSVSPTCFCVTIQKPVEQDITTNQDSDCCEQMKIDWDRGKTTTDINDGTSRNTLSPNLSNSFIPIRQYEVTTLADKMDLSADSQGVEDRLVFEASSEMESVMWISQIRQVAASLHNENIYIIPELLIKTFEYLDEKSLLSGVALTSRRFNQLSHTDSLWLNIYKNRYEKSCYDLNYYRHMLPNLSMSSSQSPSSGNNEKSSRSSKAANYVDEEDALYGEQVTWKYIFKKRVQYEKKYLPVVTEPTPQPAQSSTTQQTADASSSSNSAALSSNPSDSTQAQSTNTPSEKDKEPIKQLTKEEAEKMLKEEEERKRKDEEEKRKNKSTQYLRKGNSLFNAADNSSNIYTKRMLWMFCIDNYESCIMYNEKNWTAARNCCVALIRLEKLVHNLKSHEAQTYLVFILNQCIEKFEHCMKHSARNDEVLTLWAGTYSDIAIKVADIDLSNLLFSLSHQRFEESLSIKSQIGTYNDYGISFCDWAEKRIRHLKKRVKISTSILKHGSNHMIDTDPKSPTKSSPSPVNFSTPISFSSIFPSTIFSPYSTLSTLKEITLDEFEKERKFIEKLLDESSRLYEMCLNIKPEYFHALNNKGFNEKLKIDLLKVRKHSLRLTRDQEIETNIERKQRVDVACSFFRRCVEIKDFVIARNNYGNVLLQESKEESGLERYKLLDQCITQYEAAMILEPHNDGCICRCSIAYLMKAEVLLNEIKRGEYHVRSAIENKDQNGLLEHLYERAKVGFKCLKNTSLSHYNLACLNAIFNKKDECRKEIVECIDILSEQKLREDMDFDNVRGEPWFAEVLQRVGKRNNSSIGPTKHNLEL